MHRRRSTIRADIRIVPLEERHFEGYRACLGDVARERKYLCFVDAPPLADSRSFLSAALAKKAPFFVAVAGRRVVGWCDIYASSLEGFRHSAKLGIGIIEEFRGQGIGRRLMKATLAAARRRGLKRVELEVFASNRNAIKLDKDLNFKTEGIKRKARKIDGHYDDIVVMAK
ncbi:MAG TPA: GNAT family N-acetyltransferase, partial [Kiritimatiellia bacterium]